MGSVLVQPNTTEAQDKPPIWSPALFGGNTCNFYQTEQRRSQQVLSFSKVKARYIYPEAPGDLFFREQWRHWPFKPFALSLEAIQPLQEIRFSQNGPDDPPVWEVSIVNSGNCSGPKLHIPVRKLAFIVCRRIHLPFGNRMEIRIPPDRASKLLALFCRLHIFLRSFPSGF